VNNFSYIGTELELFANATVWKSYVRRRVTPYLGPEVLEVGAGIGATTRVLCRGDHRRWVCLEPDPELARQVEQCIHEGILPSYCTLMRGTLEQIERSSAFDTVLYIDVLEHIENDLREMARAAEVLVPHGHLVVLSPAHNWLYTSFDKAIGHYRRYSRRALSRLTPPTLELVRIDYLDAVGLLASSANRFLLRKDMPSARQIAIWDKGMVRASQWLDPVLGFNLGKSILGIWRRRPIE
jgi:hypothetical protein